MRYSEARPLILLYCFLLPLLLNRARACQLTSEQAQRDATESCFDRRAQDTEQNKRAKAYFYYSLRAWLISYNVTLAM
ncbi:MAG: hypothetical protein BYD32DRAFT_409212 [Podila humilis]|nr:MAG: hypothetical protein BYD32DRAFT_409212 [Podila humilis]